MKTTAKIKIKWGISPMETERVHLAYLHKEGSNRFIADVNYKHKQIRYTRG